MLNRILGPVLERLPENNRLELIWKLAQVDFKKRFYDSYLGLFWALLNPLFRVAIYYFVFTSFFTGRVPNYALYLFSGLLFWLFYSEGSKKGLRILKTKRYLIENIQFNKIDLFTSSTFSAFLGFFFNLIAFLIISAIIGIYPTSNLLFLPILIVSIFFLVLATSVMLATLNIYIRDIMHLWDMILLIIFWTTPIFYRGSALSGKYEFIMYLNPIAGIVINSRHILLYGTPIDFDLLIYNLSYSIILLIFAVSIFNKYSHKAAENL